MSTQPTHHTDHTGTSYAKRKLFILSVIALVTAGMVFSLRASSIGEMETVFFKTTNPLHSAELITAIAGIAFLGFAISVFIGSPLCDWMGMGRLLGLACLCFILGTLGAVTARPGASAYAILWGSMLLVGLGHGLVEAVINPLVATLYPDDKTEKLNVLHAWWPGGIIIGGLLGFAVGSMTDASGKVMGLDPWQVKLGLVLVPAIAFGVMLFGTKFPPTERVAAGVSTGEMLKEAGKPLFIILFLTMFLTASSELAPGQWVDSALTRNVGFQGILLLVYVSGLMFVMRHFAGPLAHKLSPVGLMCVSCILAAAGLVALSMAHSAVIALLAATLWAIGVCYMWPTMLGIASERFPKGGALLLGIMGSAGNLATYFALPAIGRIFDNAKASAAERLANMQFDVLQKTAVTDTGAKGLLDQVLSFAASESFRKVAILPAIAFVVFAIWWAYDKSRGGYRAEKLTNAE